ncbi:equilibrative nucleobase transporter 1 [Patella vulgata]|uniref:equilibrative nucleobase transporter 1 n=1 Tax=Patella vulgata TaxID=6465 RepID=UPI0021807A05|nr:equilibrative nucleobase transporter 1 [Patella vulgata]
MTEIKSYLAVVWCFFETLLFGGLIYGWGSLVFILIDEGVYSDLCEHIPVNLTSNISLVSNSSLTKTNCEGQDSMLTLVFTVASFLFCAGCAAMGQINYKFGTRITRIISFLLFELGALLIAFVSPSVPWLIFPGLTLIGVGGIPLLITNTQISNLFQRGSSTIVGLICGAFDGSSGVQLLVKIGYENGFSRQNSYFVLVGLHTLVLVSTFVFLPKGFIPKPQSIEISEVEYEKENNIHLTQIENSTETDDADEVSFKLVKKEKLSMMEEKKLPSLKSCLFSSTYILHVVWVCVLQLRFYYYIATLNPWLNKLLHADHSQVSYFTNVSMYLLILGVVTSPLAGMVYDLCKMISTGSRSELRRDLLPAVPPLIIGSCLGLLASVLVLVPSTEILYVLFITVTVFRSFLYSVAAAFLSAMFPSEYFGLLYGWMVIAAGIFSFFQFPLFKWSESTNFTQVNVFLLCFLFISLIHPFYQWWRCRKAESSLLIEENKTDN